MHTQQDYQSIIENDIRPALAKMKVVAVEFEDVERLHAKITKRAPVRANRVHAVLTTMFGLAVRWKMRTDNPAKGVKRNQEHGRQRYLKPDELVRLTAALAKDPNQQDADIFRLLLLTGARRGEALAAAWDQIDLDAGEWIKPYSLTKQNRVHRLPLNAPARELLTRLQESSAGSPWVFPGRNGVQPRDLKYAWKRICAAAGITGLRVHDLRHSHASHLSQRRLLAAGDRRAAWPQQPGDHGSLRALVGRSVEAGDGARRGDHLGCAKPAKVVPLDKRGRR